MAETGLTGFAQGATDTTDASTGNPISTGATHKQTLAQKIRTSGL
jgi:hypothetical protein